MKKALITGANKYWLRNSPSAIAKEVLCLFRQPYYQKRRGSGKKRKAERLSNVEAIQIDVSDNESVKAACGVDKALLVLSI